MPKILAFSGSARTESWNKKLITHSASLVKEYGADVKVIDLKDFPLPIYDGDEEKNTGIPENARKIKAMMIEHDGVIISTPEYNSEIPPLLKNTIDWVSRPEKTDKTRLVAFNGKIAAVLSAAPGSLGGARVRMSLRALLGYMGMIVVPEQFGLSNCSQAFDEDGGLKNTVDQTLLNATLNRLIQLCAR